MSIYDYKLTAGDGSEVSLSDFKGKVMMIVNTATGCGFTPHYGPMEKLYEEYHDKGLEIIDIPCNQFAGQTPGTDDEIHEFCTLKYNRVNHFFYVIPQPLTRRHSTLTVA